MGRVRNHQAGFTLIEIMFVVLIIAVLAAIALPQFMSESRKTKSRSEVVAFFSELSTRQEQFRVEFGGYVTTAKCPAATSTTGTLVDCTASGRPWNATPATNLNVRVPMQTAYCTYLMTAGSGTGTGNVTVGATTFTFASPAGPWYHIVAECDHDADGTTSKFFSSSVDPTIQTSTTEDE